MAGTVSMGSVQPEPCHTRLERAHWQQPPQTLAGASLLDGPAHLSELAESGPTGRNRPSPLSRSTGAVVVGASGIAARLSALGDNGEREN